MACTVLSGIKLEENSPMPLEGRVGFPEEGTSNQGIEAKEKN